MKLVKDSARERVVGVLHSDAITLHAPDSRVNMFDSRASVGCSLGTYSRSSPVSSLKPKLGFWSWSGRVFLSYPFTVQQGPQFSCTGNSSLPIRPSSNWSINAPQ